ncbi:hypothetical protein [Microbacterium lacticum]|uniref:hypothetical protein n=1 Tax=Microbacterium lacticum TaxID=33885 RepID=UPI001143CD17|nr:hypothetical protein [Microbacterium lacticum]
MVTDSSMGESEPVPRRSRIVSRPNSKARPHVEVSQVDWDTLDSCGPPRAACHSRQPKDLMIDATPPEGRQ